MLITTEHSEQQCLEQLCLTSAVHRKRHSGTKDHHCQYCDFSAIQSIDISRHEMRHHTKEKPYLCDLCGRGFIDVWSLKNHINSKHATTLQSVLLM